jgi:hypothetical protein
MYIELLETNASFLADCLAAPIKRFSVERIHEFMAIAHTNIAKFKVLRSLHATLYKCV